MEYRITHNLQSEIYKDALAIRKAVFIDEQKVPEELEIDDLEHLCWHLVVYNMEHRPVATVRLLPQGEMVKIQRVAVVKEARGKKVGTEIMQIAMQKALLLGAKLIKLGAQKHAIPFYQKLGYEIVGREYMDAGIPHYDMIKRLTVKTFSL